MLGSHLIQNGFNKDFQGASGRGGFSPAFFKRFSNDDKHLGQSNRIDADSSPAQAGKVMMARLVTSVESRFAGSVNSLSQAQPESAVAESGASDDYSPQAVSSRILNFVKQRLEQEKASGASEERLRSLFDQAKAGIERGFSEGRDIIADQGLFSDATKDNYFATVSQVQSGLADLEKDLFREASTVSEASQVNANDATPTGRAAVASTELYYRQKRSFDMQVKTQDGDLATIKVKSGESLKSSSFAAASDSAAVSGFDTSYSSNSRFSFSVDGELDEGELAALNDLFSQVNDVADVFYGGDVESAFQQALDVGYDTSELAGFAVNMRRSEVVAVKQTYAEVANYGGTPASNPIDGMMAKLADFSDKLRQAQESLLQNLPQSATAETSLLNQVIKEILPNNAESAKPQQASVGGDDLVEKADQLKQAFNNFVDALVA
ncbi:MAG: DUF5610 domain-containing protein [Pseudomonadales bacterium]|nr:DUF5610 domain-containing protein [Pseudomonadales bacterium]